MQKKRITAPSKLLSLPIEILSTIFEFICIDNFRQLGQLELVSKSFRQFIFNPQHNLYLKYAQQWCIIPTDPLAVHFEKHTSLNAAPKLKALLAQAAKQLVSLQQNCGKIKCLIKGIKSSGKTAIHDVFLYNRFHLEYNATLVEPTDKKLIVDGFPIHIDLENTNDDDMFRALANLQIKTSQVIVFICDLTNFDASIKRTDELFLEAKQILLAENQLVPSCVIALNKYDLLPDFSNPVQFRKQKKQFIEQVKEKLSWVHEYHVPVLVTSAKTTRENIDELFREAARQSRKTFFIQLNAHMDSMLSAQKKNCTLQ